MDPETGKVQLGQGPDADFVRRLAAREEDACLTLYHIYGPGIHAFATSRLGGDGDLAEGVMAQSLAEAVRSITRFNPRKATFSAWLFGFARRRVWDEVRKKRRRKSVPSSMQVSLDVVGEVAGGEDLAATVAGRLEAQRLVADLQKCLTDMEMEVLILHCLDQLSVREIGAVVGRSERAIHSLLHRARRKARERLVSDHG